MGNKTIKICFLIYATAKTDSQKNENERSQTFIKMGIHYMSMGKLEWDDERGGRGWDERGKEENMERDN